MVLCPLQSLKESQYFKPFEDQALQFETKLAALDEYCQNLNSIQRRWVYVTVPSMAAAELTNARGHSAYHSDPDCVHEHQCPGCEHERGSLDARSKSGSVTPGAMFA